MNMFNIVNECLYELMITDIDDILTDQFLHDAKYVCKYVDNKFGNEHIYENAICFYFNQYNNINDPIMRRNAYTQIQFMMDKMKYIIMR